jgi:hypothetical protein
MSSSRPWVHGFALIAGALLVGIAGLRHPMLQGDGAAQLTLIAATPSWRAVHWAIAFGYVLVVTGLVGVLARLAPTAGAGAARTGMFVSAFGYLTDLIGVLFMLGAASSLAAAYRTGEPGLAATHAVFVFDMLHPAARAALRIGAFAVSLGLISFSWAVVTSGALPRWLGWAGVAGGAAGVLAALALAHSPYVIAGVGLATVWQLGAGVMLLQSTRPGPTPT